MTSSTATPPRSGAASGSAAPAAGPASAASIRDHLVRLEGELSTIASRLEPSLLTTRDAAELARHADRLVRRGTALRMELAARAAEAGGVVGPSGRMVTPERWAASEFGLPAGQATKELRTAEKLRSAPGTRAAFRAGKLSAEQARQVADAVALAPGQERSLLDTAESRPGELAGRCRDIRARAGGREAEEARHARHHRQRRLARSENEDLAAEVTLVTSAPEGARFDALLQPWEQRAADRARTEGRSEPAAAIRHDALMDALMAAATTLDGSSPAERLASPSDGDESSPVPPNRAARRKQQDGRAGTGFTRRWGGAVAKVIVRIDLAALLRGHALAGERMDLQVKGRRPVPITRAHLREVLEGDPMIAFVLHEGVDIQRVVHAGRPPTALQRSALEAFHDRCADVDCRAYGPLETDHLHDWAEGGPTTLENLAPLCGATHDAKTHRGRRLHRIPGSHLVTAHPDGPPDTDRPPGYGPGTTVPSTRGSTDPRPRDLERPPPGDAGIVRPRIDDGDARPTLFDRDRAGPRTSDASTDEG